MVETKNRILHIFMFHLYNLFEERVGFYFILHDISKRTLGIKY